MPEPHTLAPPADPILASSLISDTELDEIVARVLRDPPAPRKEYDRIGTGVKSVDEALEGGLRRGSLVGVSGVPGDGGFDLCLAFLTTALLSIPMSMAAIIDTTGNLDVLRLYAFILARLQGSPELRQALASSAEGLDGLSVEDLAAKTLDRVKIMRVFDLEGIGEAIEEIREGLEVKKEEVQEVKDEHVTGAVRESIKERRTVVADSEDEDDDEMLFDDPQPDELDTAEISPEHRPIQAPTAPPKPEPKPASHNAPRISFILIDNLAHVLSPLLRKDYVQANILASSFLHSLSNLTQAHSLFTILLNPAALPRTYPPPRSNQDNPHAHHHVPIPPPSIFSANKAIPALGHILPTFLDTHLLVSRMPKRNVDAKALAESTDGRFGMGKGVEMVSAVEVLAERWGGRVGDWGTFSMGEGGLTRVL